MLRAVPEASGDSAEIDHLKGRPVIHHGRQCQVMTDSPVFSEQLKLNAFWPTKELPGSIRSPDLFVLGSFCSPTWWRTLLDQKNGVYDFDSALSPQMVWLNLRQIDFSLGTGIRAIAIETNPNQPAKLNAQRQPAAAIRFLAPK